MAGMTVECWVVMMAAMMAAHLVDWMAAQKVSLSVVNWAAKLVVQKAV